MKKSPASLLIKSPSHQRAICRLSCSLQDGMIWKLGPSEHQEYPRTYMLLGVFLSHLNFQVPFQTFGKVKKPASFADPVQHLDFPGALIHSAIDYRPQNKKTQNNRTAAPASCSADKVHSFRRNLGMVEPRLFVACPVLRFLCLKLEKIGQKLD